MSVRIIPNRDRDKTSAEKRQTAPSHADHHFKQRIDDQPRFKAWRERRMEAIARRVESMGLAGCTDGVANNPIIPEIAEMATESSRPPSACPSS